LSKIVCGKQDCEYNRNGMCSKKSIGISKESKCISYHVFVKHTTSYEIDEFEKEFYGSNIC